MLSDQGGGQQGGQPGNDGLRFVWGDSPSLRFGRALRLDFKLQVPGGRAQARRRSDDFETWELHRLRVGVDGEIFNRVQFSIERELYEREVEDPDEERLSETDAVEGRLRRRELHASALQVRAGQFKIPFGGETAHRDLEPRFRRIDRWVATT